jgi:hypothetical protein
MTSRNGDDRWQAKDVYTYKFSLKDLDPQSAHVVEEMTEGVKSDDEYNRHIDGSERYYEVWLSASYSKSVIHRTHTTL